MSLCGPACQFSARTRIVAACTRNVCAAGRAGSPLLAFAGTQETVTKPWKLSTYVFIAALLRRFGLWCTIGLIG